MTQATSPLPTYYIPHGGGPCFFMDWTMGPPDTWNRLGDWLKQMRESVGQVPKAILVISAHWEEDKISITSSPQPDLLYDYYGFPEHTYQLTWPAPGAPDLARQIQIMLQDAGMPVRLDATRGFDHGVFIPFKLIYPEAQIPTVAVSLRAGLDPSFHLRLGSVLAPLREQGVLIVGSGMSYHNLRAFGPAGGASSQAFDAWLTEAVTQPDRRQRNEALRQWDGAPAARQAHPREEHLLPLMVAAGAAGEDPGQRVFSDEIMGLRISAYRFGQPA